jgi:hypothetical protein
MAKVKHAVVDPAFLSAALEGLELQQQRIEEQIRYVKSLLGKKRPGRPAAQAAAKAEPGGKRELGPAARKRIAAAQKKRWANYRRAKKAAAKAGA